MFKMYNKYMDQANKSYEEYLKYKSSYMLIDAYAYMNKAYGDSRKASEIEESSRIITFLYVTILEKMG